MHYLTQTEIDFFSLFSVTNGLLIGQPVRETFITFSGYYSLTWQTGFTEH